MVMMVVLMRLVRSGDNRRSDSTGAGSQGSWWSPDIGQEDGVIALQVRTSDSTQIVSSEINLATAIHGGLTEG